MRKPRSGGTRRSARTRPRLRARRALLACGAISALSLFSTTAGASAANPPENIPLGSLPEACSQESAAECEQWMLTRLDAAHTRLGLESYRVPSDFISLSADRQVFILADLDRLAYGYTPISGLNAALESAAKAGVQLEDDPHPPSTEAPWAGYGSDWADTGALRAYYLWMYDDGYHSPNVDCSTPSAPGCWGHRHVILGEGMYLPQPEVLGVASGESLTGEAGTALIVSSHVGASTYYTWTQAEGEGAGGGGQKSGEGSKGEEGSKGGEGSKSGEGSKGEEGSKEGSKGGEGSKEGSKGGEGSKEGSKGGEGSKGSGGEKEKPPPPPTACRIVGTGQVGVAASRSVVIYEQLSSPASNLERLEAWIRPASRWQLLRLTKLNSVGCAASGAGYEFRGQGTATLAGVPGYELTFAFVVSRWSAKLSLEVGKGETLLYKISEDPLAAGSLERVSLLLHGDVRQRHLAGADRGKAHRALRRAPALRRASWVEDLKAVLRELV